MTYRRAVRRGAVRRVVTVVLVTIGLQAPLTSPAWAEPSGGRVVQAAGQGQWVRCSGQLNQPGEPTIVLVSGLRADHTMWSKVERRLARVGRTCIVDRPGLGASPDRRGSKNTDAAEHAAELQAALQAVGEPGPYLVIGHSYGGLIVRALAAQNPSAVRAVLLLDSVWPSIYRDFLPSYGSPWNEAGTRIDLAATEDLTSRGFTLGDRPLIVIEAGSPGNGSTWADRRWRQQQRAMANLSTNGRHWVAKRSGHVIQRDQPGIILRAVRSLFAELRT